MRNHDHTRETAAPARAFTLVELLVVIGILAILIAILVPTLGGARRSARTALAQTMLRDIAGAVDSFIIDEQRTPGYFSQVDMGHTENAALGFTAMENALLHLTGVQVDPVAQSTLPAPDPTDPSNKSVDVGPQNALLVRADTSAMVRGEKSYLSLRAESLRAIGGQHMIDPDASAARMIDVIDPFGQPIMLWTAAKPAPRVVAAHTDFVAEDSATAATPAFFYLNANMGYLGSLELGEADGARVSQAEYSAIGWDKNISGLDINDRLKNLAAALGSAAYPNPDDPALPSRPRGEVTLLSAGSDMVFFQLGRRSDVGGGWDIDYTNFNNKATIGYGQDRLWPEAGNQTGSQNSKIGWAVEDFDDLLTSTGG